MINPKDTVTITATYEDLAVAYAVLGKMSYFGGYNLFKDLCKLLDADRLAYNRHIDSLTWAEIRSSEDYLEDFVKSLTERIVYAS